MCVSGVATHCIVYQDRMWKRCDVIWYWRGAHLLQPGVFITISDILYVRVLGRSLWKGLLHHVLFFCFELVHPIARTMVQLNSFVITQNILFFIYDDMMFGVEPRVVSRRCARCGNIRWHKPVYYNLLEQVHDWKFPAHFLTGSLKNVIRSLYCPYFLVV